MNIPHYQKVYMACSDLSSLDVLAFFNVCLCLASKTVIFQIEKSEEKKKPMIETDVEEGNTSSQIRSEQAICITILGNIRYGRLSF